jgi:hypothetical protein
MGLLLTVTTSQKYPQPKSTSYPNERAPLANRYNSDRPIMTTDDDYLPVAAIEPVYGTNSPGGNYNQYNNPAGGSDNDSTKYPAKDYHVPLSYCPEVGGLESHCRPAKYCVPTGQRLRRVVQYRSYDSRNFLHARKRTRLLSQHALQWFNAASRLYD